MKCANCGAELRVGCIYCSTCGHEAQIVSDYSILEEELLTSFMNEEAKIEQPQPPKQPNKQSGGTKKQNKKKKKKKNIVPFLIAGAVIVLVTVLGIFSYIRNSRNQSFEYQYSQGLLAKSSGDYTKAVAYLKRALELNEENVDVRMELAKLYQKRDSKDLEETMLSAVIARQKDHREAYTMLIALYDSQKKYNQILSLYDSLKDTSLSNLFADYIIDPPKFSVAPGNYAEEMTLELKQEGEGEIYYTLDNADPITNGKKYIAAIDIGEGNTKVRAVTKDPRGLYSEEVSGEYRIKFLPPSEPSVIPQSGSFTEAKPIVITVPEDCTAYYTWDNTTPTRESSRYEGPLEMPEGNHVLSIIVYGNHDLTSKIVKYNYIYLP